MSPPASMGRPSSRKRPRGSVLVRSRRGDGPARRLRPVTDRPGDRLAGLEAAHRALDDPPGLRRQRDLGPMVSQVRRVGPGVADADRVALSGHDRCVGRPDRRTIQLQFRQPFAADAFDPEPSLAIGPGGRDEPISLLLTEVDLDGQFLLVHFVADRVVLPDLAEPGAQVRGG